MIQIHASSKLVQKAAECGAHPERLAAEQVRALQKKLAWAEQENVKARYRQWKFEQLAIHQFASLGTPIAIRIASAEGPLPPTVDVLGHLDVCQLIAGRDGRYYLRVTGWAWSLSSTIIAVDLFIGDVRWQQLDFGDPRKDVRQYFDGPQGMEFCGFSEYLALPEHFRPDTSLTIQVCSLEGRWKRFEIQPTAVTVDVPRSQSGRTSIVARMKKALLEYRIRGQRARLTRRARRLTGTRFVESDLTFSFLLPVDSWSPELCLCLDSLRHQFFDRWELLLVPQNDQGLAVAERLRAHVRHDSRMVVMPLVDGTLADACNLALQRATGSYLGLLEEGVQLNEDALSWAACAVTAQPQIAWLYADGIVVDPAGQRRQSDYKPDFSQLHLWSRFFTRGFNIYRREEVLRVGGLRSEFGGAEHYDLALRLARQLPADRISHLAESLFVRCEPDFDGTTPQGATGDSVQVPAVRQALQQAGVVATAQADPCGCGVHRIEFVPTATPQVVIVIPTRDKAALVQRCTESLRSATSYPNYRILVVNNQSTEPALFEFLAENQGRPDFSWVDYDRPFNHSAMHNAVFSDVDAEFAVLLNNDVSDFSPNWLEQLLAVMQLDTRIAGVGPMLLYPDRRVQHGGVIIGLGGGAAHAHLDVPCQQAGYHGRLHCLQDLSACTAACLLIRLSALRDVGGFDAANFPVAFNDVDLWLRLRAAGYRCVYQPAVTAVHYESVSRGISASDAQAADRLKHHLHEIRYRDPFYNPNLSLSCERFRDRLPLDEARREQWDRLLAQLEP